MRARWPLAAAVAVLASALWVSAADAAEPPAVTAAAILDLTGPGASLGEAERVGLRQAEREIAARGGVAGRPLRLVVVDSATAGASAAQAARHAIEAERALVLIGSSTGVSTLAVAEVARRAEVPLLALAEGRTGGEQPERPWVFQVPPGHALVASAIARDLGRRDLRRVGWLEADGPIGTAGRVAFDAAARRHGLTVVARERVAEGATDPAGPVGAVLAAKPQALVVWAIPPLAGALAQAIADLAPGLPHYQSHAAATGTFLPLAGSAAAGVRTAHVRLALGEALPEGEPNRAMLLDFAARARRQGVGPTATAFAGFGYDALQLAAAALARALGGAGEPAAPAARRRYEVRDALGATRDHVGVSGTFTFQPGDHAGLDERALVLVEAVVPPGATVAEWRPVRQDGPPR